MTLVAKHLPANPDKIQIRTNRKSKSGQGKLTALHHPPTLASQIANVSIAGSLN
jgi:hypothetical protein